MSEDTSTPSTVLVAGPCPVTINPVIYTVGSTTSVTVTLQFLLLSNSDMPTQVTCYAGDAGLFAWFADSQSNSYGNTVCFSTERLDHIFKNKKNPGLQIVAPTVPSPPAQALGTRPPASPLGQNIQKVVITNIQNRQGDVSLTATNPVNKPYPVDLIVHYNSTYSYLRVLLQ
jgi:hypothetical protein